MRKNFAAQGDPGATPDARRGFENRARRARRARRRGAFPTEKHLRVAPRSARLTLTTTPQLGSGGGLEVADQSESGSQTRRWKNLVGEGPLVLVGALAVGVFAAVGS